MEILKLTIEFLDKKSKENFKIYDELEIKETK